ncbi:hypothetical protein F4781DRAFT_19930 [Annulohypoxylon bovei var. microspora]|nr:hypothetical protein F4781DRAFT_19930 [Annulohypoxylon bovei var. microspora]
MPVDFPQDPNAAPEGVRQRFAPYFSPPNPTPRVTHESNVCPCDQCVWMRLSRRMDATPPPELGVERDVAENFHYERPDARIKHTPVAVSTGPHPEMTYPEVYVYPSTSHHITFPVVNYTAKQRAQSASPWPACYLAISPPCAKPADFEAALSPRGSGLITVARLSKTKKTAPLNTFRDVEELRKNSIQLEVWDEHAAKVSTGDRHSTDAEEGSKKKKGRSKD